MVMHIACGRHPGRRRPHRPLRAGLEPRGAPYTYIYIYSYIYMYISMYREREDLYVYV